ncbi:MAG: glycoside hydrolase family 9 protein, partial [Bacteroidia bacterium]
RMTFPPTLYKFHPKKSLLTNILMPHFIRLITTLAFSSLFTASYAQTITPFITIDQFGYIPSSKKVAVIRDPHVGFDVSDAFTPGATYAVVNAGTGTQVFTGNPTVWGGGQTDLSSGDKAWHFDFSSVNTPGKYYILDVSKNLRSFEFEISASIYNEILKQAVRTYFYQRVGFPKNAQYAGAGWADGASHIGNLQDKNCRLFSSPNSASTEKDVSGGWYDAGDYNKYTNWTANYVVEMMKAYLENPKAWGDDYNIPESGNGVPDLLDEAKWGIDHLLRMQQSNGGVLSIVSESHASPPSSATGQSLYGPATTSASLNTAAALAISSKVFRSIGQNAYADNLVDAAEDAWTWATTNPNVLFRNNDPAYNSQGIGAGQQEEDDYGRKMNKLEAACFLFEATGRTVYQNYFDQNYQSAHLFEWNFAYPFEETVQEALLYYTTINGASGAVINDIKNTYRNAMLNGSENIPAYDNLNDPYRAHIKDYTWGSNRTKAAQGNMFYAMNFYGLNTATDAKTKEAAQEYLHYLHGVNPFSMVYLSNMYDFGGDNCVNEFYHTWFTNGSSLWDRVGTSTYGPAPGFLVGGPNPGYDWDGCCPNNCGSAGNNAICGSENIFPPKNQPPQKSYKDFNTSWPLNSWSVTENSLGYQTAYIRLLSKFVADVDIMIDIDEEMEENVFQIFPNPSQGTLQVYTDIQESGELRILDVHGREVLNRLIMGNEILDISHLPAGCYTVQVLWDQKISQQKLVRL